MNEVIAKLTAMTTDHFNWEPNCYEEHDRSGTYVHRECYHDNGSYLYRYNFDTGRRTSETIAIGGHVYFEHEYGKRGQRWIGHIGKYIEEDYGFWIDEPMVVTDKMVKLLDKIAKRHK